MDGGSDPPRVAAWLATDPPAVIVSGPWALAARSPGRRGLDDGGQGVGRRPAPSGRIERQRGLPGRAGGPGTATGPRLVVRLTEFSWEDYTSGRGSASSGRRTHCEFARPLDGHARPPRAGFAPWMNPGGAGSRRHDGSSQSGLMLIRHDDAQAKHAKQIGRPPSRRSTPTPCNSRSSEPSNSCPVA